MVCITLFRRCHGLCLTARFCYTPFSWTGARLRPGLCTVNKRTHNHGTILKQCKEQIIYQAQHSSACLSQSRAALQAARPVHARQSPPWPLPSLYHSKTDGREASKALLSWQSAYMLVAHSILLPGTSACCESLWLCDAGVLMRNTAASVTAAPPS
jgi:hypothetical protein